jgi:hypothetical protein
MMKLIKTYRLIILAVLIGTLHSCASENRSEAKASAPEGQKATMEEESMDIESVAEGSQLKKEMTSHISQSTNFRKWKKKAKQQLETLQDLTLILQDSTLDEDFKSEIEKEVISIYPQAASILSTIEEELDFKNFKQLENLNSDTLTMRFKNIKSNYIASFVIDSKIKKFGNEVEEVEQIRLIKIEKE